MERWDDLRYLVAVKKAGTMSGAARLLGANVGTVSRRIERLGSDLGIQPFLKTPEGWQPNPSLNGLIEAATDFENRITVELNRRSGDDKPSVIQLRMSCPPLVNMLFLFPGLARLRKQSPEIHLTITQGVYTATLGENDVIIASELPERGRLMTRKVGSLSFGLFRPKGTTDTGDWVGLLQEYDDSIPSGMAYEEFKRPPVMRLENFYYLSEAMLATGLPGPLPALLAERRGLFERVEPRKGEQRDAIANMWVCYHETRRGDPAVETLTNWITDCFQAEGAS